MEHSKKVSSMWTKRWISILPLSANPLLQVGQKWWKSPILWRWARWCWRLCFWRNFFWHTLHEKLYCPRWICSCFSKPTFWVKVFGHLSQLNSLMPVWISLCLTKLPADFRFLPHTSQTKSFDGTTLWLADLTPNSASSWARMFSSAALYSPSEILNSKSYSESEESSAALK